MPIFYTQNDHFSIFEGLLTLWRHSDVIHKWLVLILVSMERRCPYLYTGSKFRVIWPSVLIIQRGVATTPPPPLENMFGKNPQENNGWFTKFAVNTGSAVLPIIIFKIFRCAVGVHFISNCVLYYFTRIRCAENCTPQDHFRHVMECYCTCMPKKTRPGIKSIIIIMHT